MTLRLAWSTCGVSIAIFFAIRSMREFNGLIGDLWFYIKWALFMAVLMALGVAYTMWAYSGWTGSMIEAARRMWVYSTMMMMTAATPLPPPLPAEEISIPEALVSWLIGK